MTRLLEAARIAADLVLAIAALALVCLVDELVDLTDRV